MKSRILVAVVGVPVLIYLVVWGPPVLLLCGLCVLSAYGAQELMRCVSGQKKEHFAEMVLAAVTVSASCVAGQGGLYLLCRGGMALITLFLFARAIRAEGAIRFDCLSASLIAGLLIPWSLAAFLRMEAAGIPRLYLLLPFLLSFVCDTFAFFTGKTLGRRKLAPVVSPHKTVEGAVGGLAGNLLCGLLFALLSGFVTGGHEMGYGSAAALSLLCGVAAQIGDLSFSLVKREYGIKDYGHLFLAHGGVLDRFDSVIFVTPVVELFLAAVL